MPGSRFFWQLFAGYFLLVLVCSSVVWVALSRSITDNSLEEIRRELRAEAILIEATVRSFDRAALRDYVRHVQGLGETIHTRMTVITDAGVVLADSRHDPATMDNHADRPEIMQARLTGEGFAKRFSRTIDRDMLYYARKTQDKNGQAGFVRTALSLELIGERLGSVRRLVFLGALVAALVALGLGLLMARRVTAPISNITAAARSIAAGDFGRRVPIDSANEIGELAHAFNAMGAQLDMRIDTITKDRKMLETILSGMVEGVIAIDQDERVVHMNGVAGRILEVDSGAAIGQRIWEATRVHEIAQALTTSLDDGHEVSTHARLMRGDAETLVDISAAPLHDGEHHLVGAVVVLHDVTTMRRLELVRREFVTNASHELKTPITAIRGLLETLAANPDMPADTQQGFLERAAGQGARLSTLVTDLLRLSRLEAQDHAENLETIDLRGIARAAVREYGSAAAEKGVKLRCEMDDTPLPVLSDAATLGLILDNLVDNGIKYTNTGGEVIVRAFPTDGVPIVEVQDNGIGIAPTEQARVFERFYRVDKARSRELGGTGLGLAIVKHACGVLGAEVSLESKLGRGTTFRLRLPTN